MYLLSRDPDRCKPTVSMNDLSRSVIDLAISTIKKTHHGVTIASVSGKFQPDKEGLKSDRIDFGSEEALAYLHE